VMPPPGDISLGTSQKIAKGVHLQDLVDYLDEAAQLQSKRPRRFADDREAPGLSPVPSRATRQPRAPSQIRRTKSEDTADIGSIAISSR
jgi:hypothetical protein